jgi:NAD(P)-dependent dehydrogenase (short-subunit alcohol dehydrogenase family)
MSRGPELAGRTVVVLGGSSGIGLETARRARSEGADVVLTGRNPEHLEQAALELGARSSAAFDAAEIERLERFFNELPTPIDHVMVTSGRPYYARLADIDFSRARRNADEELWLPLHISRCAVGKVRPGGTILLMGGTGGRRPAAGPLNRGVHRRDTGARPSARDRARAHPHQPDRARLRRHAAVGLGAW